MSGSCNYMTRTGDGWVEGECRYAPIEPHHARTEGGAWVYTAMHNPACERLLSLIIDGEHEGEPAQGKLTATVAIVERFPALTDSAEADYSDSSARTWLMRSNGSVDEEIEIHPDGEVFCVYSDGWDHVERDGDEWVAVYYSATIERDC